MSNDDHSSMLTNILTALTDANTVHIMLIPASNRLGLKVPRGVLTHEQRAELVAHKADLLNLAAGLATCYTPMDLLAALRCTSTAGYSIDAVRMENGRVL